LLLVACLALLTACGKPEPPIANVTQGAVPETEDDGGAQWRSLPPAPVAKFTKSNEHIVAEGVFDASGGTLQGPPGTPVEAVSVEVPAGAFEKSTKLRLGYAEGRYENVAENERGGPVIVLHSDGPPVFQKPLRVSFPFDAPGRIPVPYYVHEDGSLEVMAPQKVDRAAKRGSFITWHTSDMMWINVGPDKNFKTVWSGFDPKRDGFSFRNDTNEYAPRARCWGMSNFAKWHFETQGPGLAKKFQTKVRTETGHGGEVQAAQIVATRAHNSVALRGDMPYDQDNVAFLTAVMDALSRGAKAVPVAMENGPHVVLAIGYTDWQVAFYDNNHPGKFKALDYNWKADGTLVTTYGRFTGFSVWGGEMGLDEEYSKILKDAQDGFHAENQAKVEVTSHKEGERVRSKKVTLEGKVYSGQLLVSQITAEVTHPDGTTYSMTTGMSGPDRKEFDVPIELKHGKNKLRFVTKGRVAYQGVAEEPNVANVTELELRAYKIAGKEIIGPFEVSVDGKNETGLYGLWKILWSATSNAHGVVTRMKINEEVDVPENGEAPGDLKGEGTFEQTIDTEELRATRKGTISVKGKASIKGTEENPAMTIRWTDFDIKMSGSGSMGSESFTDEATMSGTGGRFTGRGTLRAQYGGGGMHADRSFKEQSSTYEIKPDE
jgi:hypothetical protein